MQKLTLYFDVKYNFLKDIISMFEQYSEPCNSIIKYPISKNAKPLIETLESKFDDRYDMWDYVDRNEKESIVPKNNVIVCFSGGKDSVNVALKLKEKNNVILYYLKGINRSYPNELEYAKEAANKLGLPLVIQECSCKGHTTFLENPLKNQFIFACALNYGLELGITQYFFGNSNDENIENSNFDRDFSDSKEMFELFKEWVSNEIGIEIINYPLIDSGIDSILNIGKHHDLHNLVLSCLLPYRFQKTTHINNCNKYGIYLPKNMCGSCWKCCVQYIIWADNHWLEYNKDFYKHCLDFLKTKSFVERGKKTKTYKETYIFFINEEMYNKSILKKENDYD